MLTSRKRPSTEIAPRHGPPLPQRKERKAKDVLVAVGEIEPEGPVFEHVLGEEHRVEVVLKRSRQRRSRQRFIESRKREKEGEGSERHTFLSMSICPASCSNSSRHRTPRIAQIGFVAAVFLRTRSTRGGSAIGLRKERRGRKEELTSSRARTSLATACMAERRRGTRGLWWGLKRLRRQA